MTGIPICRQLGCNEYQMRDDHIHYCEVHEKELEEKAMALYGSDKPPTILKSGGNVRYTPSSCERCGARFRFYRKCHIVFDRLNDNFKHVCYNCRKMTDSK